jgi:hypothetical protein
MFVEWCDHIAHEIDHPLIGYIGGNALGNNVVVASIDFFRPAFILVEEAEMVRKGDRFARNEIQEATSESTITVLSMSRSMEFLLGSVIMRNFS